MDGAGAADSAGGISIGISIGISSGIVATVGFGTAAFLAGGGAFFVGVGFFAEAVAGFGASPPKGSLPRTLRAIG
jgi:hypothetical protein